MSSRSKQKGNRFEREVVNTAKSYGIESKRAYASNGLSLGYGEEVDVLLTSKGKDWRVQCKVRKNIAKWIKPNTKEVDLQVVKEDRGKAYAVIPYDDFLELIQDEEDESYEKHEEEAGIYSEKIQEFENSNKLIDILGGK
jgi:Holliday junction resolvase